MNRNYKFELDQLQAADYPTAGEIRCLCIYIPSEIEHVRILAGLLSLPTRQAFWFGTPEERKSRAEAWQAAYDMTEFENCFDCDSVAECIETSQAVIDALEQNLINSINNSTSVQQAINNVYNPYNPGALPETIRGKNILPPITGCDPDELWGCVSYLIDYMHTNNLDAFEQFETITNAAERLSLLIGAIPILETLPVDEVIDYAETLWTDDVFEAYIANDTTAYRDSLKCGLFCYARLNNCSLSVEFVFRYFNQRISADSSDNLAELIAFLITGTWTGTEINDIMFAFQAMVMYYGNQFFDKIGIYPFESILALGKRNPSDAWAILCTDCGYEVLAYANAPASIDDTLNGNDTLLDVVMGTNYAINPSGVWNYGAGGDVPATGTGSLNPGAIVPAAGLARMVFRIGTGAWFATDDTFEFTAGASGRLYIACNDVPGTYGDNSGYITCLIEEV